MTLAQRLIGQLETSRKLYGTTTGVFEAADADFAPDPVLYTVAAHIAHTADAMEWFVEGAFGKGWDLNMEASIAKARAVRSLDEAREWLDRAFSRSIAVLEQAAEDELTASIPDTTIMGDAPRMVVVDAIVDHNAHHRGSLAVYARLLGKAPPMLYS